MYNVQNVNGDANNNKCFIANRDPRLSRSKKVEKIGDQYKNECNELKKKISKIVSLRPVWSFFPVHTMYVSTFDFFLFGAIRFHVACTL